MIPQYLVPPTPRDTTGGVFNELDRQLKAEQVAPVRQPDSQNVWEVAELVDAAHSEGETMAVQADVRPFAGSIPAFPTFWQKPGIGIAAVSPVPLRDSDEEKETSTYHTDEGKALGMAEVQQQEHRDES